MTNKRTVMVRFLNYWKSYAFTTELPLKEGKIYNIKTATSGYSTPVFVEEYTNENFNGITLKEITDAEEVIDEN